MKKNQIALLMWLIIIVIVGVGAFLFSNSMAVTDNDNQRIISEVTKMSPNIFFCDFLKIVPPFKS